MTAPIRKYYREIFIVIAGVVGFILYVNYQNDLGTLRNVVYCRIIVVLLSYFVKIMSQKNGSFLASGGSNLVLNTNFV